MQYLTPFIAVGCVALAVHGAKADPFYPIETAYAGDGEVWPIYPVEFLAGERNQPADRRVEVHAGFPFNLDLQVHAEHLRGITQHITCSTGVGLISRLSPGLAGQLRSWTTPDLTILTLDRDANPEARHPAFVADPAAGDQLEARVARNRYTRTCTGVPFPLFDEYSSFRPGHYTIMRTGGYSTTAEFGPLPAPRFLEWLVGRAPERYRIHTPFSSEPPVERRFLEWLVGRAEEPRRRPDSYPYRVAEPHSDYGVVLRGMVEDEQRRPSDIWVIHPRVPKRLGYEFDETPIPLEEARAPRQTANIHISWYADRASAFEVWGEIDGMRDGTYAAFDPAGNLLVGGEYVLDERHGLFLYFGRRGGGTQSTFVAAESYVMGTRTGRWEAAADAAVPECPVDDVRVIVRGELPDACMPFKSLLTAKE